jgi:spermidine synthase
MAIGFASDDRRLRVTAAKTLSARHREAGGFTTKYWTPEVLVAAFALPHFIADIVAKAKP